MTDMYYILCLERTSGGRRPTAIWWRTGNHGYTAILAEAGQYTREEAFEICQRANGEDLPVPVEALRTDNKFPTYVER